jgi:hypothetical protein
MDSTTTRVKIRPFTRNNYADMTRIHNANFAPEYSVQADDPAVRRQIYEMWLEVRGDVPAAPTEVPRGFSFEQFPARNA